jgi:glycosyltransferase involved in cell wall biosynthesis
MIYFVAPDFVSFISGGNVFNSQIYKAIQESGKAVKQIGYPLSPDLNIGKDDILLIDSIYVDILDIRQLIDLTCKKYFICHLLPSMIGGGRGKSYELQILRQFDKIIVNSRFCFDVLVSMGVSNNLIIIEPYIDRSFNITRIGQTANALIIANWLPSKQIDKLLRCLALEKTISLCISIIGSNRLDPIYFSECCQIISGSEELTKKIKILGELNRNDTLATLVNSSILLDCSSFETYGMAVAEAVASGLPVLTLGNGNIKNIVPAESICNSIEHLVRRFMEQDWTSPVMDEKNKLITHWDTFLNQFKLMDQSLFNSGEEVFFWNYYLKPSFKLSNRMSSESCFAQALIKKE